MGDQLKRILHPNGQVDKRDGDIDFLVMLNRSNEEEEENEEESVDNLDGSLYKSLGFEELGLCIIQQSRVKIKLLHLIIRLIQKFCNHVLYWRFY